jgi:hypothetical protein
MEEAGVMDLYSSLQQQRVWENNTGKERERERERADL